jgi:hypothetical protein
MDIIKRNFFRLLRSGALNEFQQLEPMSPFKWEKLLKMVRIQQLNEVILKGIKNHTFEQNANIPRKLIDDLQYDTDEKPVRKLTPHLSNRLLRRRLRKIQSGERHCIDASMVTVELLNIIVSNVNAILNYGVSLPGIAELGSFLRKKGDKVDFVKLDNWLEQLHLRRMAQLEGSILIDVFEFEQDEIPFVKRIEPAAYKLTLRTLEHTEQDYAKEWNFRQSKTGFVQNNSAMLRKSIRRSVRYINYAPIETSSNFLGNFLKSLSEIEE